LFKYFIIIIIIIAAVEFPFGGSCPYTSTDKTNGNKIFINETIQKHSTNKKHNKYKHTYYQNNYTIVKILPHTHTHTLQSKLKQPEYKTHTE